MFLPGSKNSDSDRCASLGRAFHKRGTTTEKACSCVISLCTSLGGSTWRWSSDEVQFLAPDYFPQTTPTYLSAGITHDISWWGRINNNARLSVLTVLWILCIMFCRQRLQSQAHSPSSSSNSMGQDLLLINSGPGLFRTQIWFQTLAVF